MIIKYFDRNTVVEREKTYEVLSDEVITEQSGYIPPQVQIENMINAGRRLDLARNEQFDFASEDDIDEDAFDPTRSGNFDLSDATQLEYEAQLRLRNEALEASQTVSKPSGDVPEVSGGVTIPPPPNGA